ncbi:MAG: sensor domain-containing diguanylate cyclase [Myxococcus sp.]|nr:sensor domain-containing diguanylate cyclase [Myxococcus sp.]
MALDPPASIDALQRENAALRRAVELLNEVSQLVHGALEFEATCYAVLTGVTAGVGLGFNRAMLFLTGPEHSLLQGTMAVGPADREEADRVWRAIESNPHDLPTLHEAGSTARRSNSVLDARVRAQQVRIGGSSLLARALTERRLARAEPGEDDLDGLLDLDTGLAAPLIGTDGPVGVLYADNRFTARKPDPVIEHVLRLVGDHFARAVENARRFEREARAARTDALTGLGHHGALMEHLGRAVTDAAESRQPLSLVMADLDAFKAVNDRYGHLAGDTLLAGLSARLRNHLRSNETPYRYGGEEFAVVLPGEDLKTARAVAERVRRAVADQPFALTGSLALPVTCSLGVAQYQQGMTVHAFVDAADQALLVAKREGKNRVVG